MEVVKYYGSILLRWWWLVVLCTALGGASAYMLSRQMTPMYESSTTLLVQPSADMTGATYQDVRISQLLVQTYAERLTSPAVFAAAAAEMNLGLGPEQLGRQVTATPVRDTSLIRLTVRDSDPQRAREIATRLPEIFTAHNRSLQQEQFADLKSRLNDELAALQGDIANVQSEIFALEQSTAVEDRAKLDQMRSDLAALRSSYATLLDNYGQVRIAEAKSLSNLVTDQPATLPRRPVTPDITQNTMLGGLAGLALAIMAAIVLSFADDTIRSRDDLPGGLAIPNLGVVPNFHYKNGNFDPIRDVAGNFRGAEAYRFLHTQLHFAGYARGVRVFYVTSPRATGDTARITGSLAVTMAQAGRSVVAVDTDYRQPSLHSVFGLPQGPGLAELCSLSGPIEPDRISVCLRSTGLANLTVLAAGFAGTIRTLPVEKLLEIIEQLKSRVDVVLLSGPPILENPDSPMIAYQADGVLLVVNAGRTRRGDLAEATRQLDRLGTLVVGTVLSRGQDIPLATTESQPRQQPPGRVASVN